MRISRVASRYLWKQECVTLLRSSATISELIVSNEDALQGALAAQRDFKSLLAPGASGRSWATWPRAGNRRKAVAKKDHALVLKVGLYDGSALRDSVARPLSMPWRGARHFVFHPY